jgi:hypothetical protein
MQSDLQCLRSLRLCPRDNSLLRASLALARVFPNPSPLDSLVRGRVADVTSHSPGVADSPASWSFTTQVAAYCCHMINLTNPAAMGLATPRGASRCPEPMAKIPRLELTPTANERSPRRVPPVKMGVTWHAQGHTLGGETRNSMFTSPMALRIERITGEENGRVKRERMWISCAAGKLCLLAGLISRV